MFSGGTTFSTGIAPRHDGRDQASEDEANLIMIDRAGDHVAAWDEALALGWDGSADWDAVPGAVASVIDYAGDDRFATRGRADRHGPATQRRFTAEEEAILRGGLDGSSHSALAVATVFNCCRVIAEDCAKMSRHLVEISADDDGRRRTRKLDGGLHPLARLLCERPNDWMSDFEFFEYMTFWAALDGAAYAYISRDPDSGEPLELLPLVPGQCVPRQDQDWSVWYEVQGRRVPARNIFRLNGLLSNTLSPLSPVRLARQHIDMTLGIERSTGRFHKNDARPSGILTTEQKLTPELVDKLRTEFMSKFGPGGQGGIAVLDRMFTFTPVTQSSVDSDTINHRKFEIEEICRYFRVFPTVIGHNNATGSYGSIEQTFLAHVQHTLHPWVARWEAAVRRDLLGSEADMLRPNDADGTGHGGSYGGQPRVEDAQAGIRPRTGLTPTKRLRFEMNMDGLARGTLGDRVTAYDKMTKFMMTPNEVRALEGLDPVDDPDADRIQFLRNNTGTQPGGTSPAVSTDSAVVNQGADSEA